MRNVAMLAFGLMCWQHAAPAQTNNLVNPSAETSDSGDNATGVVGTTAPDTAPEYTPLTRSERLRLYVKSGFGPAAIARAVASGGIAQWSGKPKEWGGGAEAFGERIGNSFAEHVIRKTIESGAAAVLHEDNRYIRSTETGFWKRSKHAIVYTFTARNEAGRNHFAYSRFGGAVSSAFISRIWQPHSANTSGDAAVNFGLTMGGDIGWNMVKEFRPRRSQR